MNDRLRRLAQKMPWQRSSLICVLACIFLVWGLLPATSQPATGPAGGGADYQASAPLKFEAFIVKAFAQAEGGKQRTVKRLAADLVKKVGSRKGLPKEVRDLLDDQESVDSIKREIDKWLEKGKSKTKAHPAQTQATQSN